MITEYYKQTNVDARQYKNPCVTRRSEIIPSSAGRYLRDKNIADNVKYFMSISGKNIFFIKFDNNKRYLGHPIKEDEQGFG